MKKLFAILLALTMVLGLCSFAGAEGIDEALIAAAKEEGELTVYGSCEEAYLTAACDKFEELYGIKVNCQRLSTGEVARQDRRRKRQPLRRRMVRRHHRPLQRGRCRGSAGSLRSQERLPPAGQHVPRRGRLLVRHLQGHPGLHGQHGRAGQRLGLEAPQDWDDLTQARIQGPDLAVQPQHRRHRQAGHQHHGADEGP